MSNQKEPSAIAETNQNRAPSALTQQVLDEIERSEGLTYYKTIAEAFQALGI